MFEQDERLGAVAAARVDGLTRRLWVNGAGMFEGIFEKGPRLAARAF
jgi:hypothetical protein